LRKSSKLYSILIESRWRWKYDRKV
jgi:hypothetical protein